MFRKLFLMFVAFFFLITTSIVAQNQLDSRPLDPEKDPDIDMFMSSWQQSIPYNTHGSLVERAIFTPLKGDNHMRPQSKGAVLRNINRISRGTLDSYASTSPTTLKGEQEVLCIISGKGVIKAQGDTFELRGGIFVLVPEGLEFTITNTGDELLELYLVNEPVREGFSPNKKLLVRDEKTMPFRDEGILRTHWSHNGKGIFSSRNGLASLSAITFIAFNAMTIGQPHSHGEDMEEIWLVIKGTGIAFLGKEIRWQYPGTAYKIPQTGFTPHSNINVTEKPINYLYIAWQPK